MERTERAESGGGSWSTRRKASIALGAVLLASLAYLAGSRWDPDRQTDVDDGSGLTGDWSSAETVAVDDSGSVQAVVEVAPSEDLDGTCVRTRLANDVVAERCTTGALTPWAEPDFEIVRVDDYFGSFDEHAVRDGDGWTVALSGAVHPDVVRITVEFGDGAQYSFVTRNEGGWFVTVLPDAVADPGVEDGRLVNTPVRLELFDAEGTRVASVDLGSIAGA